MKRYGRACISLLASFLLLSSCASMTSVSQKFSPQTKANVGVFADHTVAMIGDAEFGFARDETIYTREFLDNDGEEEKEMFALKQEAASFFFLIVKYSLGLVQVVEGNKNEEEVVAAYHDFVVGMDKDVLDKLALAPGQYEKIKQRVGEAEAFIDALQAAQPMISAAGRYMYQVLDDADVALDALVVKVEKKIDAEYAEVIRYQEALENEKYNILRSLAYLYKSYKGDLDAYALLEQAESIHRKDLIAEPPPSDEDLSKIANFLQNRMKALHIVEKEIESDWLTYRESHLELDRLHDKAKNNIRSSRLITILWLRAHQKMASGVANPAEWFDVKSLPALLIKAAL